jgi:peptidoglycan-associated lipoprotein
LEEEKMKTKFFAIMFVLCCGVLMAGGCAKKEVVKQDENLSQAAKTTEAPATEQQTAKEPVLKQEPVTETAAALQPFQTIYYDFDSYVLRQDARDSLDKNAQWMKGNASVKVRLEGHCDERGSDEYNLALGEKRAKSAMSYLVTLGVPESSLSVISYGKEKPADPGHDEAAWAKNRRVEFIIVK